MSGTSIAHTRDHLHALDKGDLTNPQQSAGFTVDPLLAPITTSSLPHPMTTSEPTLDPSTHHPNTHYDPEKKLSKKKRAKKFGVGSVQPSHPHSSYTGGRSFAEADKEQHEHAERRDHQLAQQAHEEGDDEEGEEDDEDDDDHEAQEAVSHNSHHENRITGSEQQRGGSAPADAKPNPTQGQKPAGASGKKEEGEGDKEGEKEGDKTGDEGKTTMMGRATDLLSSAQQTASGMMESVKQQPLVNSLLSKVGLAGSSSKTEEDSTKDNNAQAKKEEEA